MDKLTKEELESLVDEVSQFQDLLKYHEDSNKLITTINEFISVSDTKNDDNFDEILSLINESQQKNKYIRTNNVYGDQDPDLQTKFTTINQLKTSIENIFVTRSNN